MQPRNGKLFTRVSMAGSNFIESAVILMQFVAVPHELGRSSLQRMLDTDCSEARCAVGHSRNHHDSADRGGGARGGLTPGSGRSAKGADDGPRLGTDLGRVSARGEKRPLLFAVVLSA